MLVIVYNERQNRKIAKDIKKEKKYSGGTRIFRNIMFFPFFFFCYGYRTSLIYGLKLIKLVLYGLEMRQ